MGLSKYVEIARRRWIIIVACVIVGLAVATALSLGATTTYQASSRLFVTMATGTSVNDSYQGGLAAQQRVVGYTQLATGSAVAERAVRDAGVSETPAELQSKLSASFVPGAPIIDITVTDSERDRARFLTDKVVAQFRSLVDELETTEAGAASAARVSVVGTSESETGSSGSNLVRNLAAGLVVGLIAGFALAWLWERLDPRLWETGDIEEIAGSPVWATVGASEAGASAALRRVRAHLLHHATIGGKQSVMVVSPAKVGVEVLTGALAQSLSRAGHNTALLEVRSDDAAQSSIEVLGSSQRLCLKDVIHTGPEWIEPNEGGSDGALLVVDVDLAKDSDLFDSDAFGRLIDRLAAEFDNVLVSVPPALEHVEWMRAADHVPAALIVVGRGKTKAEELRDTASQLADRVEVLGVVAMTSRAEAALGGSREGHSAEHSPGRASADQPAPDDDAVPEGYEINYTPAASSSSPEKDKE